MSFQTPLISIPKKTTHEVDWAVPIRTIIAQSYGEDPKNYAEECSVLQRCRQDAVKGAGSDQTARDLLYKYFGQLELLELRFSEIKVPFVWTDAFTLKETTQTSLAFEKASIIHLLASVLSSLATSCSRADPEGVKRAYFNLRASAGMLTYINDNFLHAPSTDLSREVVQFLTGVLMAQSTEVFTAKLIDEKKAPALVCRSANSAAVMYAALVDEMKEFQGKGIFDRNWLFVLQIKAKLFASMAQYYRSIADASNGKHGPALVRLKLADATAQDASKQAATFSYGFYAAATPSLPSDAGTSLVEITKAHATLCVEAKDQAVKDNELIYHDILPSEASLPIIEKLPAATPITIQEVYANPDVSKLIGPDIFARLIPLAVHESASVYSEEKAKLIRGEVERVDLNEGEIQASLEHLGLPSVINLWRSLADEDGPTEIELSPTLHRLAETKIEDMSAHLQNLISERESHERELRELGTLLDNESRECERMRAKYAPQFTQSPSGQQTGHFRANIASNLGAISAASSSDEQLRRLWREIQPDIATLARGPEYLRTVAQQVAAGSQQPGVNLLDLDDVPSGLPSQEKQEILKSVLDAQERLDRLGKIRRERDEVLKDLKDKLQNDDVSNLLLLNRRSQHVEPQLFATELEKFRPFQARIAAAVQASGSITRELEMLVRQVERGKGVKERQKGQKERQRRVRDWERSLERAGESLEEVRAGASKGLSFYESMAGVLHDLSREVRNWVKNRDSERNRLIGHIETRQRISSPSNQNLESQFAGMSFGNQNNSPPPKSVSPYPPPPIPSSSYHPPSQYPAPPAQQEPHPVPPKPYAFASAYPAPPTRPPGYGVAQGRPSYTPSPYPPGPPPGPPLQPHYATTHLPPQRPSYPAYAPPSGYKPPPPQQAPTEHTYGGAQHQGHQSTYRPSYGYR